MRAAPQVVARRVDGPAWNGGQAMGFRFDRATLPVEAFAELYPERWA